MNFNFVSVPTFEPWDWTNPDEKGIGGSETSHIEMATRLGARGHDVYSYAPIPGDKDVLGPNDVLWSPAKSESVDWERDGVWVIYRAPETIDSVPDNVPVWHVFQDVDYGNRFTLDRLERVDRLIALCPTHARYLMGRYPEYASKVCISSNGIKAEYIREILKNPPERNPHRLIWASSPDRGLEYLLKIFPKAREVVRDLELHIYYGFDNIDKVIAVSKPNSFPVVNARRIQALMDQPGVFNHGRTGQRALLEEWFKAGIWCHPSNFTETSCITSMDAQACGAIPITKPVWAIAENVKHGVFIDGDVTQELIQCRFALELIRMALDPERQAKIRETMMPWALLWFPWERWVDQWEAWATHDLGTRSQAVPQQESNSYNPALIAVEAVLEQAEVQAC